MLEKIENQIYEIVCNCKESGKNSKDAYKTIQSYMSSLIENKEITHYSLRMEDNIRGLNISYISLAFVDNNGGIILTGTLF